jgi:hypothetical protein
MCDLLVAETSYFAQMSLLLWVLDLFLLHFHLEIPLLTLVHLEDLKKKIGIRKHFLTVLHRIKLLLKGLNIPFYVIWQFTQQWSIFCLFVSNIHGIIKIKNIARTFYPQNIYGREHF